MPKAWKIFEQDCVAYLSRRFGQYAQFEAEGGSDSTVPDIRVTTVSGTVFYIEAKMALAQSGQFVLLAVPEQRCFIYSPANKSEPNKQTNKIVSYMNAHFDNFVKAGTKGVEIVFKECERVFAKWIVKNYKNRKVRFVITEGFGILPIENFENAFAVSAVYRVKKSGSTAVGKKNIKRVKNNISYVKYSIVSTREDGKKLFVTSEDNINKKKFKVEKNTYMFSRREPEFEVRKLSNTANANVIFSVVLKEDFCGLTDEEFIRLLEV